jgi:hypothetical protein
LLRARGLAPEAIAAFYEVNVRTVEAGLTRFRNATDVFFATFAHERALRLR